MKKYKNNKRRSGMALMTVLFVVFAVTVVSMGLLFRSDMALASGRNLALRNQSDYLAWAGLEHARAVIQSYGAVPLADPNEFPKQPGALIDMGKLKYTLSIKTPSINGGDPNDPNDSLYTYDVSSEGYYYNPDIINDADKKQASSKLYADIVYDPNDGTAIFSSIRREE